MRSSAFLLSIMLMLITTCVQAQGFSRSSAEERAALVHEKFKNTFNLSSPQLNEINTIFIDFYTAQDRLREDLQGPAPSSSGLAQGFAKQDFQSVRKRNENIVAERDNRLKRLLTPEQYKRWLEEIEPSIKSSGQGRSSRGRRMGISLPF